MDHLCFVCLVFLMLSRLFITALWSPAGKWLTSWLLLVMFNVFLLLFMWYPVSGVVLVSFPDLCHLSYFRSKLFHTLMVFLHYTYFIFFFYKNLKKKTTAKLKFEELINYCYI